MWLVALLDNSHVSAALLAKPYKSLEDDPEDDLFEFPSEDAPYVSNESERLLQANHVQMTVLCLSALPYLP